MKIQQIEAALRKQLPFRQEQHFFMRTDVTKDALMDAGMVIICGLSSVYVTSAEEAAVKLYDLNPRLFKKYSTLYFRHIDRAALIIASYDINLKAPDFYKQFSNKFWLTHNVGSEDTPFKTGVMLSHVLSSRREYNIYLKNHTSHFQEDDFTSFFIFNKAQLTINYLRQKLTPEKWIDSIDMGY